MKNMRPLLPYGVFLVIALLLLAPLLAPGFILTLDMVFTPHIAMPTQVTSSYLFYVVLHILNLLLPGDVIQKILLVALLAASGSGMYRLAKYLSQPAVSAYAAGLLYMINPFVYSRFMAGQFAVLLGYACLPFFVLSLLKVIAKPSWRQSCIAGAWLILIGIVSIHTLALAIVILAIELGIMSWQQRKKYNQLLYTWKMVLLMSLTAIIGSIYWLLPLAEGRNVTAAALAGFGAGDQAAFATAGDSLLEKVANVVQLQGFWTEPLKLSTLPQTVVPGWPILTILVLAIVIYGGIGLWKHHRSTVALLSAAAAIGIVIATIAIPQEFLHAWPALGGLREPHKFVGLVALAYGVFFGAGAGMLVQRMKKLYKSPAIPRTVMGAVLLVPFAWTPTMLGGMYGQLVPRQYPAEWYAVNQLLDNDPATFHVLFLPWHGYQYFDFAGRIIATPADRFFDKPTIVSNELEFRGASPTFPDINKSYITDYVLPNVAQRQDLAPRVATISVKYIVMYGDDKEYSYLTKQTDLQLVYRTGNMRVYKNQAFRG